MNESTHAEATPPNLWQRIPGWARGIGIFVLGLVIGSAMTAPDVQKVKQANEITTKEQAIYAEAQAKRDDAAREQGDLENQKRELREEIADAKEQQSTDARVAEKRLKFLKRKINGAKHTLAKRSFSGDGTYLVGKDIEPGTYKASASTGCYWARLSDADGGGIDNIIDNNNTDGPAVITVGAGDFAVQVARCGTFRK
jgi:hypothetical protein